MARPPETVRPDSLAVLIDQFLDWTEKHRAPNTYIWYQSRLQEFVKKYPDLLVSELKPYHVQQWIDGYDLSSGSKRNFARSIMQCMTWCEEQGLIDRNPIRHFKKPRGGRRDTVISQKEYERILACFKRPYIRDLLTFAWETGARAQECLTVERRHVDLPNSGIVFPVSEEKMERAPRIIYLNETAKAITRRLDHDGHLFRNMDGKPWTTDAVNCAFIRVQKKLGKKYCLTLFRHSFAHRLLRSGVDRTVQAAHAVFRDQKLQWLRILRQRFPEDLGRRPGGQLVDGISRHSSHLAQLRERPVVHREGSIRSRAEAELVIEDQLTGRLPQVCGCPPRTEPVSTFCAGDGGGYINIALFENHVTTRSGDDRVTYGIKLKRSYKDNEGKPKDAEGFQEGDLGVLSLALSNAAVWIDQPLSWLASSGDG